MNGARGWYTVVTLLYDLCYWTLAIFDWRVGTDHLLLAKRMTIIHMKIFIDCLLNGPLRLSIFPPEGSG